MLDSYPRRPRVDASCICRPLRGLKLQPGRDPRVPLRYTRGYHLAPAARATSETYSILCASTDFSHNGRSRSRHFCLAQCPSET